MRKLHVAKKENIDKVEICGSGKQYREFMHVDDMAEGTIFLLENYDDSDFINLGIWREYIVEKDNKFHEANLLELDIIKSTSKLNWKPKLNFKDSITMTVDWYKEFYFNNSEKDSDILDFINKQIKKYIKK
ncbi:GDP-L-fucose synthase [Candidatus Methanobinarius endosymbioticus]|uniref:GDP-L-fucose synthase n=1 Tax=Candidatus Methanobinarius endosymbioticus TaxID=2006182 RepID=A0A366M9K4_9EURY|nr:GDP-L-fucose synthase [Candidatus Methanobinarius endosymbioticus]